MIVDTSRTSLPLIILKGQMFSHWSFNQRMYYTLHKHGFHNVSLSTNLLVCGARCWEYDFIMSVIISSMKTGNFTLYPSFLIHNRETIFILYYFVSISSYIQKGNNFHFILLYIPHFFISNKTHSHLLRLTARVGPLEPTVQI